MSIIITEYKSEVTVLPQLEQQELLNKILKPSTDYILLLNL